jgi:hypothetical protein
MSETTDTSTISDADKELANIVGNAMKTLSARIRDPAHPLHKHVKFDETTGRPILPEDDATLLSLISAALDEPGTN